jgi:hypothetical protein
MAKQYNQQKRAYWRQTANLDWLADVFEKRKDNTSCVHDIARIWQPEGKIDFELINVICEHFLKLRKQGIIKLIRNDTCEDLDKSHHFYRIRQRYERADEIEPRYSKKKRKQNKIRQAFKTEKPIQEPEKISDDSLAKRVINSNLPDKDKLEILKGIL